MADPHAGASAVGAASRAAGCVRSTESTRRADTTPAVKVCAASTAVRSGSTRKVAYP